MYDPPSQTLTDRLEELGICRKRDVLAQYRIVRRLARDLPTFDSVWIDALVQAKKLTRFQATVLESKQPDRLQMGPCLILDQLSHSNHSETYLARHRKNHQKCVLKVIPHLTDSLTGAQQRLQLQIADLKKRTHQALALPTAAVNYENQLLVVSPYVPGVDLRELMIRRGRFPSRIVLDIASQIIETLTTLEARGYVHSDLRLSKIRLRDNGRIQLVDVGLRKAIFPQLQIPEGQHPERYDFIAPELIGTTQPPNSQSDIYAFGCLLWQLLAGRPPFMTSDPLAKLAAHQTESIADVREWAPDTSEQFAKAIRAFTAKDPQQRPQSFREIRSHWKAARMSGQLRLKNFRAKFNTSATTSDQSNSGIPWKALVPVLFIMMGLSLTLLDQGARGELLSLAKKFRPAKTAEGQQADAVATNPPIENSDTGRALHALPAPDAQGVIRLTEAGPYDVAELSSADQLVLRGDPNVKPVVLIRDRPLKLWANLVMLENVRFRFKGSGLPKPAQPDSLVRIQSQNLVLKNCRFETGSVTGQAVVHQPAYCVAWKQIEPGSRAGGQIHLQNCLFLGHSSSLYLSHAVPVMRVQNVGKFGNQPFITLAANRPATRESHWNLSHMTLRESGPLLRILLQENNSQVLRLFCQANNCVFDLHKRAPRLIEQWGSKLTAERLAQIEMYGEGSLCSQNIIVAAVYQIDQQKLIKLPDQAVVLEGITAAPYRFQGPLSADTENSIIQNYEGPRRTDKNPGLIASEL